MLTKKYIALWILSAILVLPGCKKANVSPVNTSCVNEIIVQMQAAAVTNPPASIWQYTYNGQKVYYIPAHCCDIPSTLLDINCNVMCSPDGGLSGKGDGRCPDFINTATGAKLIWKDPRG